MAFSQKVLSSEITRWMLSWPHGTTSVSPHQQRHGPSPSALSFFTTPFPYHSPAKLGDKRNKKRISRETQWVFSMRTQRMKHADILQGRQKKCPLEQLQQSAGQRRRGWPWQITNKRMDKTSLARQKPPWKSTVSRKGPETRYSYFIGLLVLLSSSRKITIQFNYKEWNYLTVFSP